MIRWNWLRLKYLKRRKMIGRYYLPSGVNEPKDEDFVFVIHELRYVVCYRWSIKYTWYWVRIHENNKYVRFASMAIGQPNDRDAALILIEYLSNQLYYEQ